jgi:hypothetical protein
MPARPVAAVAALLALALVPATARADRTIRFVEVDKGSTFHVTDIAPKAPNPRNPSASVGDQLIFTNPLATSAGKHLGQLRAVCTVMNNVQQLFHAAVLCTGAVAFKDGQISIVVTTGDISRSTTIGAVVGGTGAYEGARGTFKSVSARNNKDTLTLLS